MKLSIDRTYEEKQTKGYAAVFDVEGTVIFTFDTLELPWKDNQKRISCIPKGVYDCRVRLAEQSASRDYTHLIVDDVPNRSYILFHRGNSAKDSRGCILTGMMRGDDVVYQSKSAHNLLMKTIIDNKMENKIELVIKNR
jgi:hypothetical protein